MVGQGIDVTLYKSKVTPLVEAMLAEDESMIDASVATLLGGYAATLLLHDGRRRSPHRHAKPTPAFAHHNHDPTIQVHPD